MTRDMSNLDGLTDEALLDHAQALSSVTHESTAELVAHLSVIDSRGLYLGLGFSSMFA